jgi:hypothetical protein
VKSDYLQEVSSHEDAGEKINAQVSLPSIKEDFLQ